MAAGTGEEAAGEGASEEDSPEVEVVEDDEEVEVKVKEASKAAALLEKLQVALDGGEDAKSVLAEVLPELTTEVQALDESVGNVQAASVGLEDQVEAMKDQYLRLNADFDNFRKRTEKEKTQLSETTRGKFMEALLPVLDNFELAKANVKPESEEAEKVQSSYQVLYTQMMDLLSAQGLNVVDGVGSKFDPNIHEAIMKEESTEAEDDTVLEEFRKGYVIGEKLIRAAMVKVAVNPAGAAPAADGDAPADEEVKEQA